MTDPVPFFRDVAATYPRSFWLDGGGARDWSGRRSMVGWLEDDDVSLTYDAATRTVTRHAKAGKLTLTGPASCLPAVSVGVGVKTHPAHHWKRHGHTLRLNGHRVGKAINGAALKPATRYTLKATATFVKTKSHKGKKHKVHKTVRLSLVFTTCGRP